MYNRGDHSGRGASIFRQLIADFPRLAADDVPPAISWIAFISDRRAGLRANKSGAIDNAESGEKNQRDPSYGCAERMAGDAGKMCAYVLSGIKFTRAMTR
jgi:hypothetical protein